MPQRARPDRLPDRTPAEGARRRVPDRGEVRIGPLRPVAALLHEQGADPAAVLAACGLPPAAFDDADRRIPFRTAACLLQQAA